MSTRGSLVVTLVALTLSVALVGCSRSAGPQAGGAPGYQAPRDLVLDGPELTRVVDSLPTGSPQRPLLADRKVTTAELALSWRRLRGCLGDGGLTVSGPFVNPITNTEYLFTYAARVRSAETSSDQTAQACEARFWTPLSQVYAANTPQHLDPTLARYLVDCMGRAHYSTHRSTTFDDIVRGGEATPDRRRLGAAYACLDAGMPVLFPRLPYFPRP
jgi:hypothetical protein